MMDTRLKSWALWLALASLLVFVVMQTAGVDIGEPVSAIMALLLPVLVAFGIINDPTVHNRLFGDGSQYWYQSWAVWLAMAALIAYCVKYFFNIDIGATLNGLMDVLLPALMALGIVNNPTSHASI